MLHGGYRGRGCGGGGEPINMVLLFGKTRIHPLQIYTFTLTSLLIGLDIIIWSGVALPFRDVRQPTRNITYFASMAQKIRTV